MRATPSSKSSRSPASDLLPDRRERVERVQNGHVRLPLPVDDCVRQGLELVSVQLAVEARPGLSSVVERHLARLVESAGRGNAHERAVHRPAGERGAHDRVPLRGEQERQGRRAVAEVGAGDLAGLDRGARAVEDVVGDLEGDPEREAVLAGAAAEPARRLEELPRLQRAALEVRLDRRRRVVRLRPLQRLAAREAERRVGEDLDRGGVSGRAQLREGAREEVVAGRARGVRRRRPTRRRPCRGGSGRGRSGRRGRASPCGRARPRRRPRATALLPAERERKTSAGRSRLPPAASASFPTAATSPGWRGDACARAAPRARRDSPRAPAPSRMSGQRVVTSPPLLRAGRRYPRRRAGYRTASKPHAPSSSASSSGPGKRRTLAGRYVYASPPGRTRAEQRHDAVEPELVEGLRARRAAS